MSELVIGTRRATFNRLRALAIAVAVSFIAIVVSYFIYGRLVTYAWPEPRQDRHPLTTEERDGRLVLTFGASSFEQAGALRVVRLHGDAAAIGTAHARLLEGAAVSVQNRLLPVLSEAVGAESTLGRITQRMRLTWRLRFLDDQVPGHQLVELAALAGDSYENALRSQAATDIGVPPPQTLGRDLHQVARSLTFLAPVNDPSGDRLLIGRSFGMPGATGEHQQPVVFFVHPDSAVPFVSVAWPGAVGVFSGMNASGIAVMLAPASSADVEIDGKGTPLALLCREVLESASTMDQAVTILKAADSLGAGAILIVEGKTRQWTIVEKSPTRFAKREGSPVIAGLLESKPFSDDARNDRARRSRPASLRIRRVESILKSRPPGSAEAVAAILRDQQAADGKQLPLGHRGAIEDYRAEHAAIFDPTTMTLWVSDGPGAHGEFRAFDARHELGSAGGVAAPPAEIAAERAPDRGAVDAILQGFGQLEAARNAWFKGDKSVAMEKIQRALAITPHLPAALLFAGHRSVDLGDGPAAKRYFTSYLAAGADDLGAKEQVEAIAGPQDN